MPIGAMSRPSLFDGVFIHSIDDLGSGDVESLLARAEQFEQGVAASGSRTPFSAGLVFLAPSLRTRVGFAAAAVRLGGMPIEVRELRSAPEMSAPESFEDTLRTVSGMVDVTVVRTPFELVRDEVEGLLASPCVNAGDGDGHHPTQALIDLYAIRRARGPLADLRIGICGDLSGRTVHSLLKLMDRTPPLELGLTAPPGRRDEVALPIGSELRRCITRREPGDFAGLDLLYLAGMPAGTGDDAVDGEVRRDFALNEEGLRELPGEAVVLAPMPIVDEIAPEARGDQRVRIFDQSDWGVPVRMAVLEALLSRTIEGAPTQ
jgi:aspartate carbamoyltransferase catalytic subunit